MHVALVVEAILRLWMCDLLVAVLPVSVEAPGVVVLPLEGVAGWV